MEGSWNSLGTLWGAKMASRSDAILDGRQFCFRSGHFCVPNLDFHSFGAVWGRFWKYLGKILEDFWPDFLKLWETHHLCLEIAHYMRFKTIALQKWLNKNGLHPGKHVSHP